MHISLSVKAIATALVLSVSASFAESVDELLKKGDVLDKKFAAKEALDYYLPAEKLEPNNPKVLTRIARQYRHLMSDASKKWDKLKFGGTALSYAQRAV